MTILNTRRRIFPKVSKRELVIARDGLKCCWCGVKCEPTGNPNCNRFATLEHVVRRADGGSNDLSNLKIACRRCNNGRHGNLEISHRQRILKACRAQNGKALPVVKGKPRGPFDAKLICKVTKALGYTPTYGEMLVVAKSTGWRP